MFQRRGTDSVCTVSTVSNLQTQSKSKYDLWYAYIWLSVWLMAWQRISSGLVMCMVKWDEMSKQSRSIGCLGTPLTSWHERIGGCTHLSFCPWPQLLVLYLYSADLSWLSVHCSSSRCINNHLLPSYPQIWGVLEIHWKPAHCNQLYIRMIGKILYQPESILFPEKTWVWQ